MGGAALTPREPGMLAVSSTDKRPQSSISFEATIATLQRNYTRWPRGGRFRASGVLFYPLVFVED